MTEEEKRFRRELESAVCPTFPNEHRIVDAAVEIHVAVVAKLKGAIVADLEGPPATISYMGALLPVNSTGMRQLIDDNADLREQIRLLEKGLCGRCDPDQKPRPKHCKVHEY